MGLEDDGGARSSSLVAPYLKEVAKAIPFDCRIRIVDIKD